MITLAARAVIFGAGNRGGSTVYKDLMLSYSPIAYWRLGEANGTIAVDEVGFTNGTYVNTPTLGTTSLLVDDPDTAVTFTVSDTDHMIAENQALFNIATISVSVILQVSAYPIGNDSGIIAVMDVYGGNSNDKALRMQTDGRIFFYVFDGAQKFAISADPVPLNEPVHVVGTVDSGTARIYINGVEAGTVAASTSFAGFSSASIIVGGKSNLTIDFTGTIDEVSVFDYELNPSEILDLYNAE